MQQRSASHLTTRSDADRCCEQLEQYIEDHRSGVDPPWKPELLRAIIETGAHNYSIFLDKAGFAFAYLEVEESLDKANGDLSKNPLSQRWEGMMSKYTPKGARPDDEGFKVEYEHYCYVGSDRLL